DDDFITFQNQYPRNTDEDGNFKILHKWLIYFEVWLSTKEKSKPTVIRLLFVENNSEESDNTSNSKESSNTSQKCFEILIWQISSGYQPFRQYCLVIMIKGKRKNVKENGEGYKEDINKINNTENCSNLCIWARRNMKEKRTGF
ncbi:13682_t:CDS:2, partial [Rhizophagus irregularis]